MWINIIDMDENMYYCEKLRIRDETRIVTEIFYLTPSSYVILLSEWWVLYDPTLTIAYFV